MNGLFGLHKNFPIMGQVHLRLTVAETIFEISKLHCSSYLKSSKVVMDLCRVDSKKMDDIDYDVVIETLSALGDVQSDRGWSNIYNRDTETDPALIVPVVGCCFSFLLHDDGVVTRTALKALQKLTTDLSNQRLTSGATSVWNRFLEKHIMPTLRCGLTCRDENTRSYFLSLTRCVIEQNSGLASIHLHTDLSELIRNDQEDLDFFINIRHVQVHRRARALQRLRKIVNISDQCEFSPISVSSILLPLAIHPIYESQSKATENYALEGIATTGCLARLLPWNKYNSLLWTHLTQFERHPEQEKYLIGLLCALVRPIHRTIPFSDFVQD
jgi:U3 small nucleolar RNA-associated protein 20